MIWSVILHVLFTRNIIILCCIIFIIIIIIINIVSIIDITIHVTTWKLLLLLLTTSRSTRSNSISIVGIISIDIFLNRIINDLVDASLHVIIAATKSKTQTIEN